MAFTICGAIMHNVCPESLTNEYMPGVTMLLPPGDRILMATDTTHKPQEQVLTKEVSQPAIASLVQEYLPKAPPKAVSSAEHWNKFLESEPVTAINQGLEDAAKSDSNGRDALHVVGVQKSNDGTQARMFLTDDKESDDPNHRLYVMSADGTTIDKVLKRKDPADSNSPWIPAESSDVVPPAPAGTDAVPPAPANPNAGGSDSFGSKWSKSRDGATVSLEFADPKNPQGPKVNMTFVKDDGETYHLQEDPSKKYKVDVSTDGITYTLLNAEGKPHWVTQMNANGEVKNKHWPFGDDSSHTITTVQVHQGTGALEPTPSTIVDDFPDAYGEPTLDVYKLVPNSGKYHRVAKFDPDHPNMPEHPATPKGIEDPKDYIPNIQKDGTISSMRELFQNELSSS